MIWFTCVNYDKQPQKVKEKIKRLCKKHGGQYEEALFVFLTRENVSIPWIEQTYYVQARTLYRRRKSFYEDWFRDAKAE